ncbi:hypothetical protein [Effusibacillus pohliae]|uniref:hypothetical protein n=1 Tax=Effusibacillus pohliae TaxID=232270 RepID=UPI00036D680A|nr:hypothetical protein [Effusibacillus pohliae]
MVPLWLEGTVRLSLFALAILHLVDVFFDATWSHRALYVILVFLLLTGLFAVRGIALIISGLMLFFGHLLLFLHGGTFGQWGDAITKNVPLLSLLILVPLIQIPFQAGGFLQAVEQFVRRSFDSQRKVVIVFGTVVFVIGSLLNLGGLRFLSSLAEPMEQRYGDLVLRIMCRSFVSSIMWSPYFATVGLTLFYLHLPVQTFLPPALTLSLCSLAAAFSYTLFEESRVVSATIRSDAGGLIPEMASAAEPAWDGPGDTRSLGKCLDAHRIGGDDRRDVIGSHGNCTSGTESRRKLQVFFLLLFCLLAAAFVLEQVTRLSMLTVISVLSLCFPLLMWGFVDKTGALQGVKGYMSGISKLVTEVMLFTSAGFMGGVLSTLDLGSRVAGVYGPLAKWGVYPVIFACITTVLLLALLFVHPILSATVLLTSVPPDFLGIHPITMGLSVLAGWSISMTVSVISPFIVIMSGIFEKNLLEAGWRQNRRYMLVMTIFLSLVIWGIDRLFLHA